LQLHTAQKATPTPVIIAYHFFRPRWSFGVENTERIVENQEDGGSLSSEDNSAENKDEDELPSEGEEAEHDGDDRAAVVSLIEEVPKVCVLEVPPNADEVPAAPEPEKEAVENEVAAPAVETEAADDDAEKDAVGVEATDVEVEKEAVGVEAADVEFEKEAVDAQEKQPE
jgi:hypothetical protein